LLPDSASTLANYTDYRNAYMAYTLAIYTHPSTGKDRDAAGKVAGMLGWACAKCGAAYFGTPPDHMLCGPCAADEEGDAECPSRRDPGLKRARWLTLWLTTDLKGYENGPRSDAPRAVLPGSGGRI
jgi:hypothetical protein